MIEGCFNFLKSAGLHSGIIFICKIRGQIMCKHKTIANYASDWLTHQVNQSKAWFPKYLPSSYVSKSLAHDPALNQKWEEKKKSLFWWVVGIWMEPDQSFSGELCTLQLKVLHFIGLNASLLGINHLLFFDDISLSRNKKLFII